MRKTRFVWIFMLAFMLLAVLPSFINIPEVEAAENEWELVGNRPKPGQFIDCASIGDTVYAINGRMGPLDETPMDRNEPHGLWKFNTSINEWTQLADPPYAGDAGTTDVYGGKIYYTCAYYSNSTFDRWMHIYNVTDNIWYEGANLTYSQDGENLWDATGAIINGKFYVVGGAHNGIGKNYTYSYDIAGDTWANLTECLIPIFKVGSGEANNKLYVFGWQFVYEYDPIGDDWTKKTGFPVKDGVTWHNHKTIATKHDINGLLYVQFMKQDPAEGYDNALYSYNPITDEFSDEPIDTFAPNECSNHCTGSTVNGTTMIKIGGESLGYAQTWTYAITLYTPDGNGNGEPPPNEWVYMANRPEIGQYINTATIGNYIYTMSGRTGVSDDPSCYRFKNLMRYDTTANTWANLTDPPIDGDAGVSDAYEDKIYYGLFYSTNPFDRWMLIYNTTDSLWYEGANLTYTQDGLNLWDAAGAIINGKFYVVGGTHNAVGKPYTYSYDIAGDTWANLTSCPISFYKCSAGEANDKMYVFANYYVYEYDPGEDEWTTKSAWPTVDGQVMWDYMTAVSKHDADGMLYVQFMKKSPEEGYDNPTFSYNVAVDEFSDDPIAIFPPNECPSHCNGEIVGNTFYKIGGSSMGKAQNWTYALTFAYEYSFTFMGAFDEVTGNWEEYNERAVTVTIYFEETKAPYIFELNGTKTVGFDNVPLYFLFDFVVADREYWLGPNETNGTFYALNGTFTGYTIRFLDLGNMLTEYSWIEARRKINGTLTVCEKRKADIEKKVVMNLLCGSKYSIYISNDVSIDFGDLLMTPATTIQLTLTGLEFPYTITEGYRYLRVWGYRVSGTTCRIDYQDLQGYTTKVTITYYFINDTIAYETSSSSQSFISTWSGADEDTTYYVVADIERTTGDLGYRTVLMRAFSENPWGIDLLWPSAPFDTNIIIPALIILCVAGVFSSLSVPVGAFATVVTTIVCATIWALPIPAEVLVLCLGLCIVLAVTYGKKRVIVA